ncbi:MAG: HNH endonuclease signature motif containing protein [Mycobacteriaceae bacterium]
MVNDLVGKQLPTQPTRLRIRRLLLILGHSHNELLQHQTHRLHRPSDTPAARCRFPGCTRHRKLHVHHVRFWSDDGLTDLANLILLCSRHHTLVHAQGFQLQLHRDRSLTVTTADGVTVPHLPALPWRPAEELDTAGNVKATTLPPTVVGQRLDLDYAVSVVLQQAA